MGIQHSLEATFWDGEPEPQFTHLGAPGTYDTEPDDLAARNQEADKRQRQTAVGKQLRNLPMRDLIIDFED
jgi:hypothetical protein